MLINDSKKACFYHVMKTGGHSIFSSLRALDSGWNIVLGMHGSYKELYTAQSDIYFKIRDKKYYKFCCVRNPFSHAVSMYFHIINNDRWYKELHRDIHQNIIGEEDYKDFNNFLKNIYKCQIHSTFKDEYFTCDRYLKFETLDKHWDELCNYLDYPKTPLLYINKTKDDDNIFGLKYPSDYRSMYDQTGKDIIYDRCNFILSGFDYDF